MVPGNAKKSLLDQRMDGNKPILVITHGHKPISDMIIVVRDTLFPCLEFLEMFTGSVQQIITPSDSSADVTLLRRRNLITAVSGTVQFLDSRLQRKLYILRSKPGGKTPIYKDRGGCSSYLLGVKNTTLLPLGVFSLKRSTVGAQFCGTF